MPIIEALAVIAPDTAAPSIESDTQNVEAIAPDSKLYTALEYLKTFKIENPPTSTVMGNWIRRSPAGDNDAKLAAIGCKVVGNKVQRLTQ